MEQTIQTPRFDRIELTYVQEKNKETGVDTELPLKVVVLGDFTGKASEELIENRPLISIDSDNFNDVLKEISPTIHTTVPNELDSLDFLFTKNTNQPSTLPIQLTIEDLEDFTPDHLIKNVPELAHMLRLRELLVQFKQAKTLRKRKQVLYLMLAHDIKHCARFLLSMHICATHHTSHSGE